MYAAQVEAFQQAFGKDRVHVVLYDDIQSDIHGTCRGIFEFIGVDPGIIVDDSLKGLIPLLPLGGEVAK